MKCTDDAHTHFVEVEECGMMCQQSIDSECAEMNLAEMNLRTVKGRSQMMKRVGEKEDTMRRGEPILQACLEFDDIHIGLCKIIGSMKNNATS